MNRLEHLCEFYTLLAELRARCLFSTGCDRVLRDCSGESGWPTRGVCFFFEHGETRSDSGEDLRVVRVGTHGISSGSRATLWHRLAQHRGTRSGAGNHRGSVFRKLVGSALASRRPELAIATWGQGHSATAAIRHAELALEQAVSDYIGAMPFVWVAIDDEPSKESERAFIERNAIALLSNATARKREVLDAPSPEWLGAMSNHPDVRRSGLWNSRDVTAMYDPAFLQAFSRLIEP
jgi:hypothetical protein